MTPRVLLLLALASLAAVTAEPAAADEMMLVQMPWDAPAGQYWAYSSRRRTYHLLTFPHPPNAPPLPPQPPPPPPDSFLATATIGMWAVLVIGGVIGLLPAILVILNCGKVRKWCWNKYNTESRQERREEIKRERSAKAPPAMFESAI